MSGNLRMLVGLVRNQKLLYPCAALGWVLYHSWPLLPGLLGKWFFDVLARDSISDSALWTAIALVAAAGLARIGIILGASLSSTLVGFRGRTMVQRNMMARLFRLPGAHPLPESLGAGISTLRDDTTQIARMDDWVADVLAAIVFAGSGIAILLYVDAWVTLLVLVPMIVVISGAHAVRARARSVRERSRAATADVTGMIAQIVTATATIRAAAKEDALVERLRTLGDVRKRTMIRDRVQSLTLDAIFDGTAGLGATLTLLVAAARLRSGAFTTGDFVLFSTYLMQVANYTGFLGYLIRMYQQMGPSLRRCITLLQGAPLADLTVRRLPVTPQFHSGPFESLAVQGLSYHFDSGAVGIADISFEVRPGTLTVITGITGAGKTTLVRAMLGLLPLQDGVIRWNGIPVDDPADFLVPPRIGYTAQTPLLLSGTLRENVLLGLPDDGRAEIAVSRARLDPDLRDLSAGLDTEVGVRGIRLSGGQVQRAAAARMFARRPQLLVVDDLSSALDVETERQLWEGIRAAGTACVAVSHRPAVLGRADDVLLMHGGRIVARGPFAQLLGSSRNVRELLEAQR